jgi:hypothetical protein
VLEIPDGGREKFSTHSCQRYTHGGHFWDSCLAMVFETTSLQRLLISLQTPIQRVEQVGRAGRLSNNFNDLIDWAWGKRFLE